MDAFKSAMNNYYKAEMNATPMDKTTANDVNNWVSDKTDKMIEKLIDETDIDAYTRTILVNTLLFDAEWTNKFNPEDTTDGEFTDFS